MSWRYNRRHPPCNHEESYRELLGHWKRWGTLKKAARCYFRWACAQGTLSEKEVWQHEPMLSLCLHPVPLWLTNSWCLPPHCMYIWPRYPEAATPGRAVMSWPVHILPWMHPSSPAGCLLGDVSFQSTSPWVRAGDKMTSFGLQVLGAILSGLSPHLHPCLRAVGAHRPTHHLRVASTEAT